MFSLSEAGYNRVFANLAVLCYTAAHVHPPHEHRGFQGQGSLALA
jgi:hypothetical protein